MSFSRSMVHVATMMMAMGADPLTGSSYDLFRRHRHDILSNVDIEKEYLLIQAKKSKLSANQRAMVVRLYERRHGRNESNQ